MAFAGVTADPFSNPGAWDSIQIGPVTWGGPPYGGSIEIVGASRYYKIDQKDAPGNNGATLTYRGVRPKPFKLVFGMWTSLQYTAFTFIQAQFYFAGAAPTKQVNAVPVAHPVLAQLQISSVMTEEIEGIIVDKQTKFAKCSITVREFIPAIPTPTVSPTGTPAVTSQANNPTGFQPSARVAALQAQVYTESALTNAALSGAPGGMPSNR